MSEIQYLLTSYKPFDELESADLELLRKFVASYGIKIYDRTPGQPTITASAIVVNPDFTKMLLMHHRLHGFYKQFGGHADGNPDLAAVAADELLEESGHAGRLVTQHPIDLIRWNFPDRDKDGIFYPAHDCFDIAFLFIMDSATKIRPNKKEVIDTKWEKLKTWRDYSDMNNPVYAKNPQNVAYQNRIYKKLQLLMTR